MLDHLNGNLQAMQDLSINIYLKKDKFFQAETLYVSTDGAGSHTYSYVLLKSFVPNSNVIVLLPKNNMSLETKLLYAAYITANRFKFSSWRRKPKGDAFTQKLLFTCFIKIK